MRVIGADGEMVGVLTRDEALALAEESGMDLVEIQPNADPPVCRVMDFGKFKFETQKKASAARKSAVPPAPGGPTSSWSCPRPRPPPSAASSDGTPVGSGRGDRGERAGARRTCPSRSICSSSSWRAAKAMPSI